MSKQTVNEAGLPIWSMPYPGGGVVEVDPTCRISVKWSHLHLEELDALELILPAPTDVQNDGVSVIFRYIYGEEVREYPIMSSFDRDHVSRVVKAWLGAKNSEIYEAVLTLVMFAGMESHRMMASEYAIGKTPIFRAQEMENVVLHEQIKAYQDTHLEGMQDTILSFTNKRFGDSYAHISMITSDVWTCVWVDFADMVQLAEPDGVADRTLTHITLDTRAAYKFMATRVVGYFAFGSPQHGVHGFYVEQDHSKAVLLRLTMLFDAFRRSASMNEEVWTKFLTIIGNDCENTRRKRESK